MECLCPPKIHTLESETPVWWHERGPVDGDHEGGDSPLRSAPLWETPKGFLYLPTKWGVQGKGSSVQPQKALGRPWGRPGVVAPWSQLPGETVKINLVVYKLPHHGILFFSSLVVTKIEHLSSITTFQDFKNHTRLRLLDQKPQFQEKYTE